MYNLNTYQCIGTPTVKSNVTIDQWFSQIKESPYLDLIKEARGYMNLYQVTSNQVIKSEYDKIKRQLPTITYNSTFTGYRSATNFSSSTGLMYIDADKNGFTFDKVDKNKLFAAYKSIGGIGYGLLVRVEGLTLDNYEATYKFVIADLKLSNYHDSGALGMIQQSVISYDPNLYYNQDSFIYKSINNVNNYTVPNHPVIIKKEEHYGLVGYSNINDFKFDGDYIYNWKEGFDYVQCYMPIKPISDGRKRTISSYTNNLIVLNPNIQYYHAFNIVKNVNERICTNPLEENYLHSVLKQKFQLKNEGKLIPIYTKRRILFKPNSDLNIEDKLHVCGQLIKEKFENEGCYRINDVIESWDFKSNGLISIRNIAKYSDINKKTIAKYYHHFKDFVCELNLKFKNS